MSKNPPTLTGILTMALLLILDGSALELLAKGGSRGGGGSGYRGGGSQGGGHTYVRPHTRRDGTYVQPHNRTTPNSTQRDNFSSRGNVNPYTGKPGTRNPER